MNPDLVDAVSAEREKQAAKGYTPEHDDTHTHGDIGVAAACYATPHGPRRYRSVAGSLVPQEWPWNPLSWKPAPGDRKREIVKAVALLEAEYERISRAEGKP